MMYVIIVITFNKILCFELIILFLPKIVMFVGVITQFMLELYLFLPFNSLNPFQFLHAPSTKIDNKLRNDENIKHKKN